LLNNPAKEPKHRHSAVLELSGTDVVEVGHLGEMKDEQGRMVIVRETKLTISLSHRAKRHGNAITADHRGLGPRPPFLQPFFSGPP
jgi:hypothetical protein